VFGNSLKHVSYLAAKWIDDRLDKQGWLSAYGVWWLTLVYRDHNYCGSAWLRQLCHELSETILCLNMSWLRNVYDIFLWQKTQ